MKVLLINGSPRKNGCTHRALEEVARALASDGIDSEIVHADLDKKVLSEVCEKAKEADGLILGSPVYYAAASGLASQFYTDMFSRISKDLRLKPAAAVVSCRRGGASSTFDQLNKFFLISQMIVVGSNYWNQVHGSTPEEVEKDIEGLQTMRVLGQNMSYVLRALASSGASKPEAEEKIKTDFIR